VEVSEPFPEIEKVRSIFQEGNSFAILTQHNITSVTVFTWRKWAPFTSKQSSFTFQYFPCCMPSSVSSLIILDVLRWTRNVTVSFVVGLAVQNTNC